MEEKEYDEMTNEELERMRIRAEENWENLKDRVHDLHDENERLRNKMRTMAYTNLYVKKDELGWVGEKFDKDIISVDELISKIEDLYGDVDRLEERIEEIEQDIEDNYKPIDPASQYGVSESWFH